jgi:hypothetical protein
MLFSSRMWCKWLLNPSNLTGRSMRTQSFCSFHHFISNAPYCMSKSYINITALICAFRCHSSTKFLLLIPSYYFHIQ